MVKNIQILENYETGGSHGSIAKTVPGEYKLLIFNVFLLNPQMVQFYM